jgi:hypothetical protein
MVSHPKPPYELNEIQQYTKGVRKIHPVMSKNQARDKKTLIGVAKVYGILYFFLQIGSHASRTPPVDHELWSRSRVTRASVEPPSGHAGPQTAQKVQKDEIFGLNFENFEVSHKNSPAAEMSNR